MAYKYQVISPSALASTEACPRFRPDGNTNDAAEEGTLLHGLLEEIIQQPKNLWEGWIDSRSLSAEHKAFLKAATDELQAIIDDDLPVFTDVEIDGVDNEIKPGLYPELRIETEGGRHGYIDLLVINYDHQAIIIDYKSIRVNHKFDLQLGAYALYLYQRVKDLHFFECRIIAPRLNEEPEVYHWNEGDLASMKARILEITKRADESANNLSIVGCPGDQCAFCHWNGKCPYQTSAILDIRTPEMQVLSTRLTPTTLMHPATPVDRGLRRECVKFVEAFIKAVKDDDKAWVEEHGGTNIEATAIPGWKLAWRNSPASLDESRDAEARTALMETLGFSIEEIMECSKLSLGKLSETVAFKYGYPERKAKLEVTKTLDPFMKPSGKVLYWTKTGD